MIDKVKKLLLLPWRRGIWGGIDFKNRLSLKKERGEKRKIGVEKSKSHFNVEVNRLRINRVLDKVKT